MPTRVHCAVWSDCTLLTQGCNELPRREALCRRRFGMHCHTYVVTERHTYIVTARHIFVVTMLHTYIVTNCHTFIVTYSHIFIVSMQGV